jgi:hypothetical protein
VPISTRDAWLAQGASRLFCLPLKYLKICCPPAGRKRLSLTNKNSYDRFSLHLLDITCAYVRLGRTEFPSSFLAYQGKVGDPRI